MRDLAFELAKKMHKSQVDKNGVDYMQHILFVEDHVTSEDGKIVALLHDIIEDTEITKINLIDLGFSEYVVNAVLCLTKGIESREEYLSMVKTNDLAREVKLADLSHNSMISRYVKPTERDVERCIKYLNEMKYLLDTR